jgi:hypothetical protein
MNPRRYQMLQPKRIINKSTLATGIMILLCTTQQLACGISPSDEEATPEEEAATTQLDPEGIRVAKDLRALSAALDHPVHSFERPAGIVHENLAASPESRAILGIDTWRIYLVPRQGSDKEMVDIEGFTKAGHEPLVALRMSPDPSQEDTAFKFDGKEYKLTAYPTKSQPPAIRAIQALWDFEARKGPSGVRNGPSGVPAAALPNRIWCPIYSALYVLSVDSAVVSCGAAAVEDFANPVADASCLYSLYSIGTNTDNVKKYCGRNPPALPSLLILPGSYKKSCNLGEYRYHASRGKAQVESSCQRNWPRKDYITSKVTLRLGCLPVFGDLANCDGQLTCGKCR